MVGYSTHFVDFWFYSAYFCRKTATDRLLILSIRSHLESCELAGCKLQCDVAKHRTPRLFYTEALQQALSNDPGLQVRLECGHGVVPECSTCSRASAPESNDANDGVAARSIPQKQAAGDSASASTEASVCDNSTDSESDAPTEDTRRTEAEAQGKEEDRKKDPNFLLWLPYYRKSETGSPAQADGQKELSEGGPVPEQKTEGPIEASVDSKETTPSKESAQDRAESKEACSDSTRKSDSSSQPDTGSKASTLQRQKLSKDTKLQRAAALKQQKEERKKAHEEEIQDITEEIAHQREVLRSRRDQKKHQKKLQELQKQLERLCQKELDDSDYATTDDEADNENTDESSDQPSHEKDGDASKDEDDSSDSVKKVQSASEKDGDKPQEPDIEDPNIWAKPFSKAKQNWEDQKQSRGEENSYIDEMMDKIGLESVKAKMLEIKTLVDTARRQDVDLKKERFNTVFMGNPGTGKTTVASMLANLYGSLALVDDYFTKTSGSKLVYDGVNEVKNVINNLDERGVVFIDDAHILRPDSSSTGRKVLDYIVSEMDRLQGQMIFIFAGYGKQMEAFLAHNSSLQSRIPFTIKFDDYEDVELLQILQKQLHDKFNGKMKVDKGIDGVYMRMTARRIGRGRGNPSFGNAREAENTLQRILFRQAARLEQARKSEQEADDLLLTMEDVVGPPPSTALESSKAWKSLQEMVGLKTVKESLKALVQRLQINYDRELVEKPIVECSLNKIFLGSPGTGKTTVAKHYGQIMVDIGLLSDGEVVVKNPADFIGQYLGESENITKQILASTRGKVLIIDEAYGLSDMSDETNERACGNIYKTAIVDTLVSYIQGTANEDRCVLLLGYRERMERMFQHVNPGLSRRFPMSSAFEFDDFTDEELRQILDTKVRDQGFTMTDQARQVALEMLSRARNHLNFGNAGEIDIILGKAKESQQARLVKQTEKCDDPFLLESQDFDTDFERSNHAEARIKDLFKDFVGAEKVVEKLLGYSRIVQNTKALGLDPRDQIPFNYLFRGPPGELPHHTIHIDKKSDTDDLL